MIFWKFWKGDFDDCKPFCICTIKALWPCCLLVLKLGNVDGSTKSDENKTMSALSLGNPETAYAHKKSDRGQSYVKFRCCSAPPVLISGSQLFSSMTYSYTDPFYGAACPFQAISSYLYTDPFYGGTVATYGSHGIVSDPLCIQPVLSLISPTFWCCMPFYLFPRQCCWCTFWGPAIGTFLCLPPSADCGNGGILPSAVADRASCGRAHLCKRKAVPCNSPKEAAPCKVGGRKQAGEKSQRYIFSVLKYLSFFSIKIN
jgi:hypothetical protein